MKIFVSPQAHLFLSTPETAPFLKGAVKEILRYGLDAVQNAHNPFFHRAPSSLWWDEHSPLALYHKKADPQFGDYALIFEKPLSVGLAGFVHRAAYFTALLPHCTEMAVV